MSSKKPISRQRQWQIDRKAEGLCVICSKPSYGKCWCDSCAAKKGTKLRHKPLSYWEGLDWSLSNRIIGVVTGSCQSTIIKHRAFLEQQGMPTRDHLLQSQCWTITQLRKKVEELEATIKELRA